jgi:ElaB/YqjD/DUF883 family membrane-anchored ribosome-binding protein
MDQSTEMSEHEMSVIRSQMDETRSALTDKLERLERQVTDTVQGAADTVENMKHAVEDTVSNVKSTVQETVSNVTTSMHDTVHAVGEALSIRHHVERHPWAMMAGATAVGFVGGYILLHKSEDRRAEERFRHLAASQGRPPESSELDSRSGFVPPEPVRRDANRETMRGMRSGSGTNAFMEWLKPATSQIQSLAVGAALGLFREMVTRNIPKPMTSQVNELFDGLTTSLGGQVIHGSLLDQFGKSKSGSQQS